MLTAAVSLYRSWPYRPHCGAGRHVWLCRVLRMPQMELCPNTHPGGE